MWEGGTLMTLNVIGMTWKSTSSIGWEYLVVWEDLGSSPMYAICVLFDLLLFW